MTVVPGLERLLEDPSPVGDRAWALLGNCAAVTRALDDARIVLPAVLPGPLVRLFAPEHGWDGVAQDMEQVADGVDPVTRRPARSLYGATAETLRPRRHDLDGVAVVVVDLPDIGCRYYTFAATMDHMMAACASAGVEMVVCDRPNPLGGVEREGGLVQPGHESFVSQLPAPIKHGLTLGELALLLARERHRDLELTVVPCHGWRRDQGYRTTGLPWVPPSPNMPTAETAAIYPGACLVEATTLSEGRGTTRPFHLIGAPGVDAEAVVGRLGEHALPGLAIRAARFRPMFGKHAGAVCAGVELHVGDDRLLRPVAAGLVLLRTFAEVAGDAFAWRRDPYEFVADVPAIDLLTGGPEARDVIEGRAQLELLLAAWEEDVRAFEATLEGVCLYR